ncbi:hypothetical protein IMZ11_02260 [Microtetraspora sp. AC03309]|uniref:hypothetical protein n=1 Tax=Microtetraspora sp. AC03309 TaxID=2779376 RepID=UPI001E289EFF|nr:hypothetical protein [Microtetraspora sp. AC03309]MCC5574464.1 hypothetical protein [Microtetraspora sp. AC03309]
MDFVQLPIIQGGALAVLLAACWLVYSGRLVPRSVMDDLRKDRDARVAEIQAEVAEYKAAWLASEQARHEQDGQMRELMELARTTDQAIRALAGRGGSRDAVAP